jgi:hypothetical protein
MKRLSHVRIALVVVAALTTNPVLMVAPAFAQFESSESSSLQPTRGYDSRIIEEVVVNGRLMSLDGHSRTAIELPRDVDSGWPN